MTGEIEGEDRKAASGEPGRQLAPSIQVFANIVHEHHPTLARAETLAAQHRPVIRVISSRAAKLDGDGPGGVFHGVLASHVVKCRSRC